MTDLNINPRAKSANVINKHTIDKRDEFISLLVEKISVYVKKIYKRALSTADIAMIQSYISKIKINPNTSLELAVSYHIRKIYEILSASSQNDIHEYLKDVINTPDDDQSVDKKFKDTVDSTMDTDIKAISVATLFLLKSADSYRLSKELVPSSKLKYNYLMLDSNNIYSTNSDRTTFKWLINQKGANVYSKGHINLPSIMRNIKMARLGRMTFAYAPLSFVNLVRTRVRIGFSFDEFASQALIMPSGVKFNFLQFLPESDTNYGCSFTLTPFFHNRGYFRFRDRYKNLDSLTLNIWNLFTPAKIPLPDVFTSISAVQNDSDTFVFFETTPKESLLILDSTFFPAITDGINANLYTNEQVVLSGFTTLDPVGDAALITAYNSTHTLTSWSGNYYLAPSPVGATLFGAVPVTVTFIWKPRFTGVLELISEDDEDEGV